ncbi:MAG TPA: hypothetical protein DEO85_05860 [Maritimibacter sp.]|nr:hypothetical protein [Maritimibacter sp.]
MEGIDLWAILAGTGVMIAASLFGGFVFAFGAIADIARGRGGPQNDDDEIDKGLEAQLASPTTQLQLTVLSWMATMLGGATTGLMSAGGAVTLNAFIVGLIALGGAFLPAGPIPRRTLIFAGVMSVPCAMLGAILVT